MQIREHSIPPPLRPYVRLIWSLEGDEAWNAAERIVPDCIAELVFHWRTPFSIRFAGAQAEPQPRSFVLLQTRRFVEIRPRGASGFVAVRFQPWGVCHFIPGSLAALADRQVAAADLWGREAELLEERLGSAERLHDRVRLVAGFLMSQLSRHQRSDRESLARTVWRSRGTLAVRQLSRHTGLGERHLQRAFAADLGTSPKQFARISRFLHACELLRSGRFARLTDVAHACGYYDQSHFNGDFRKLAGLTPGDFGRLDGISFLEID